MEKVGTIEQVVIAPLKKVVNDRGHLIEVQRDDDEHYPGFGQVYVTATKPGVVKAWYRHSKQVDQIILVQGVLRLVLYDTRENSMTRYSLQEICMEEGNPLLVQIPPGVWHGFKALANEPTLLLHLNTVPFDFGIPDEDRLPDDHSSIPYRWDD